MHCPVVVGTLGLSSSNDKKKRPLIIVAAAIPHGYQLTNRERSRRKKRRVVRATTLSLKGSLITERAHVMAALESASKRISVFESDIARHILNAVSRKHQTAPCLIQS
jgi:hypothetical protein